MSRQYLSGAAKRKLKLGKEEQKKKLSGSMDRFFNKILEMEYEKSKQKYLDKLKKTSSKGLYKSTGILDIQNDNSLCFNESHQKYVKPKCVPNDLLAKVECYIRANPSSHITKNRLTVKRGLAQRGFASNVQTRNNLDIVHKSGDVKDLENVISFIKPKRQLVDYKPETKIKFGPPDATSTIKHKQAQSDLIFQKQILKPTAVAANIKYKISEKIQGCEHSSSSKLTSSKIITSIMQGTSSTLLDPEINKNKCISIEEKARLNSTYCLYLEFVHTHCNEIISIDNNIYPNNDYSVNLKKQLQLVQLKHQHQQDVKNKKLIDCTDLVNNDKSINDFNSASSVSGGSDFIFKPVVNLFKSPGLYASTLSQDSFVCSTQEISFTNSDNSMNINEVKLDMNKDYFSSPEICLDESTKNKCEIDINDYQPRSSFYKSLEKSTQKSKDLLKTSSASSEDSFKYYKKKMF